MWVFLRFQVGRWLPDHPLLEEGGLVEELSRCVHYFPGQVIIDILLDPVGCVVDDFDGGVVGL